ncbi:hypothetical protein B0J15DRAFT_141653 [Fusarium solani]|uniref:Zn(2)-C6 fungal-type domain-containing protein n=1 Tax=Fusarium solani TaxID=169388 RepID=A0A9P9GJP1_FUSSL|nr:uncharacterized protein B0J15DRAFT_141653 [Fusarium solani]KAH7239777.1 hypothetical protein B0J15DRAFT_141653 [Fusarium solani]
MKGCSMCSKRRIRCDNSRPTCTKCLRKGLDCPGYEPKLRWVGGPAVRGRLKGFQPQASSADIQPSIDTSFHSFLGYPLQELVDYYDKQLCKIMVWVDSADNIYRRYVLPLAQTNLTVRLSVAAVSAQHAAASRGACLMSEDARNQAISVISRHITDVTNHLANGHEIDKQLSLDDAEWMLACMLVLSCYEMAHSGASAAEIHRSAARSLVNTLPTAQCRKSMLFMSLRNMLSTYEVFASTTCFDLENVQDAILPISEAGTVLLDESILFAEYLGLLHQATVLARQPHRVQAPGRDWRTDFEMARGTTLMIGGRLSITAQQRRDLIRLVDIHHNAALLYVSRCLGYGTTYETMSAFSDLKRQLLAFEDIADWTHNLAWLVFIAGVECHGDAQDQKIVSDLYETIVRVTRLKSYREVLCFLQDFWSGSEPDWQVLAREWELLGKRVLPY